VRSAARDTTVHEGASESGRLHVSLSVRRTRLRCCDPLSRSKDLNGCSARRGRENSYKDRRSENGRIQGGAVRTVSECDACTSLARVLDSRRGCDVRLDPGRRAGGEEVEPFPSSALSGRCRWRRRLGAGNRMVDRTHARAGYVTHAGRARTGRRGGVDERVVRACLMLEGDGSASWLLRRRLRLHLWLMRSFASSRARTQEPRADHGCGRAYHERSQPCARA
jgi:hypothetical protein